MPRWGGRRAQRFTRLVLAVYGDVCHLCGHAGADSADHLQTRSARPDLIYSIDNARPAHHLACPICGVRCNSRRGTRPLVEPGAVFGRQPVELIDGTGYVD